MGVNKVIYGNDTLIDITDSTVTTDNLAEGAVAYGANGERIIGQAKLGGSDLPLEINEQGLLCIIVEV